MTKQKKIETIETRISNIETKLKEIKTNLDSNDKELSSNNSNINNSNMNDSKMNDSNTIYKFIDNLVKTQNISNRKSKNDNKNILILRSFYVSLIEYRPNLPIDVVCEYIQYFANQSHIEQIDTMDSFSKIVLLEETIKPKFFKILNSCLEPYHKRNALLKLQMLDTMKNSESVSGNVSGDYFKMNQWIDNLLDIPFSIYKTPAYLDNEAKLNPAKCLSDARTHLNSVIYGQFRTKQHIIEILARMISNPKTLGSVFAIHGEAGTGKTTLIKDGLSKVFGLPFVFISLGGAQDRTVLAGSNYVYEGSACGKIIQSIKQSQCMNPIFYFDELDKVSTTDKGNEIINLLIHLTDYTQNSHFLDDYMDGITIDLSRATFIFSFNDKLKISPILLDRMEIIKFKPYSQEQKQYIARYYLLPNIVNNIFGFDNKYNTNRQIIISDKSIAKIVNFKCNRRNNRNIKHNQYIKTKFNYKRGYQGKGGVRYIKKRLERILARININILSSNISNDISNDMSNDMSNDIDIPKKNNKKINKNIITNSKNNLLQQICKYNLKTIHITDNIVDDVLENKLINKA